MPECFFYATTPFAYCEGMIKKVISIAVFLGFSVGLAVLPAGASATHTQEWVDSPKTNITRATSNTEWTSVATGRADGPGNSMNFGSVSAGETIRLTISLAVRSNNDPVDVSSMTCEFPDSSGRIATLSDGTTVTTVSADSSTVVCDLTFGTRTLIGFALYEGVSDTQKGYLFVSIGSSGSSSASAPLPAKYAGPEFSALSGMGIMTGSTGKLEGKRLDQISSIEIGGKAATFTANSATELELSLPAGLAPGLYDLVINSSAGKLTQINAIQVREPKKSFSITTKSTGKISNDQYIEHSLIASMQIPELDKARCIVNASTQAMAQAMANRLCAVVKASNPNIETTIIEPRTTVKGDAVYARVTYGWN